MHKTLGKLTGDIMFYSQTTYRHAMKGIVSKNQTD